MCCLLNMESQSLSIWTMDHSLPVPSSLSLLMNGTLHTIQVHPQTHEVMDKLKQHWRLSNVYSHVISVQAKILTWLYLHTEAPLLMPTYAHLQRCPANVPCIHLSHNVSSTRTHMQQPNMIDWMNMPFLSAAHHDHIGCRQKAPPFAGQPVSVLNNDMTIWLPATVVHAADHGSYIVQVISSGQHGCTCDHIHKHHTGAIKPDVHTTIDIASATLPAPVTKAVHIPSPPPAAPTTLQLAAATRASAATHSLQKTPFTVHTPQGTQQPAVVWQQTGETLVALHWSARSNKLPIQLIGLS